ncbi:hypothetical protein ACFVUN_04840 [Kitasatospora griseola]|uniref:hypothetical protein n=1 Tax=Kitasatospora griseola TaxID=2064 RepID=UPI0036DB5293
METGGNGFTVSGDPREVGEALALEAGLARALDGAEAGPAEASLRVDAGPILAEAERMARQQGPGAAREYLMRESRRYVRWLRPIDFGLAGNDSAGPDLAAGVRGTLVRLVAYAVVYGEQAGVPADRLAADLIGSGAVELGEAGLAVTLPLLSNCYLRLDRPELALTTLLRCPPTDAVSLLGSVLLAARLTWAAGGRERLARLVAVDWRCDPTGLAKELVGRLVTEREPTPPELAARQGLRHSAFERGDWAGLRRLALSDVIWLEDTATLWRALSAILRMNRAVDQSELADAMADRLERRGDRG